MRLIDADALLVKQANIAKTFARSDAQKSLIGRVMYNTERAPTIPAIPVEWLRKKIKEHTDEEGWQDYLANSFGLCIEEWQKEQEAQDG